MSVATTRRRLIDHWARINGVKTAHDSIPRKLQIAQLPSVVIFPAEAALDTDYTYGEQIVRERRVYRMVLYLEEMPLNEEHQLQIEADPFFEAVKDRFVNRPQLLLDDNPGGDAVLDSNLLGDGGLQVGPYPLQSDSAYLLIEWRIEVIELVERTNEG
jgi:hypothetical protein